MGVGGAVSCGVNDRSGRNHAMKVELVFDDWRQVGEVESIYSTEIGLVLSAGDFHSGTVFCGELKLDPAAEQEIEAAFKDYGAYPVFRLMVRPSAKQQKRVEEGRSEKVEGRRKSRPLCGAYERKEVSR